MPETGTCHCIAKATLCPITETIDFEVVVVDPWCPFHDAETDD